MGSSIVFEFLRTYPEQVLGAVQVSSFSEVSDIRFKTEIRTAIYLIKQHALKSLAVALAAANADSPRAFLSMCRTGMRVNPPDVLALFECALTYNCTEQLSDMRQPVQLVFGANDGRLTHYAQLQRERIPDVRELTIPKVRHPLPTKATLPLNQCIADFVRCLPMTAWANRTPGGERRDAFSD